MKIESFFGATIVMSQKIDGDMRIGSGLGEDNAAVAARHRELIARTGVLPNLIVCASLLHGNSIGSENALFDDPREYPDWVSRAGTDGLVTNKPGIMLAVGYADCLPVVVYDPVHHAVGVAHCGWKGLASGVLGHLIASMKLQYGTMPQTCRAFVGPGIERSCYEVRRDVFERFYPFGPVIITGEPFHLDLRAIIVRQLAQNGITMVKLDASCTFCDIAPSGDHSYFSGRRDKTEPPKTNMCFVALH